MADDEDCNLILYYSLLAVSIIFFLKKNRRRAEKPPFNQRGLYKIFLAADDKLFRKMVRVGRDEFNYILDAIMVDIRSQKTHAVPPDLQLLVTLHFLAHGSTKIKTGLDFELGEATISRIINKVCDAIIKRLGPVYLSYPTEAEWIDIEKGFHSRWNVPNMLGAIDGKHFRMQKPARTGSVFYNYKGYFSVSIMAVVDHNHKFRVVDVGGLGSDHDGGFLKSTAFGQQLYGDDGQETLNWPPNKKLPGPSGKVLPHYLVGDDAFQLNCRLMKPYPGRGLPLLKAIFNFRISRARQIVECAFGILAARWRLFQTSMVTSPERAKKCILTAIILHNMLCTARKSEYIPNGFLDEEDSEGRITPGSYRQDIGSSQLRPFPPCLIRNSPRNAGEMRNDLADYFVTDAGRLSWQEAYVRRGS